MSAGQMSERRSRPSRSQGSKTSDRQHVQQTIDLQQHIDTSFEACDATASFFLHAQHNAVVCLHHDTLAVERRFEKHREDVLLISADNVSERGAGRLVVSYDAGQTAIVWDIFTGEEIARFASYEQLRVAAWMRDGSIAFGTTIWPAVSPSTGALADHKIGNSQGNIILFETATSEHVSSKTIFDPVTALAPASDCKTFAIGYLNGSILIATLQPFTILHTLNTSRGPSPITGLAWHGSSSKQKTEMLATQTSDGDLRVWSVTKPPINDPPRIIRVIGGSDTSNAQRSWFAWSKNGRLVQYCDDVTRAWDVRTKKVTHENIPTIPDVAAITNYGPTASLFTVGPNYMIQQYDLNPSGVPAMVANIQHVPPNAPPTPPDSIPRETPPPIDDSKLRISLDAQSSEDDGPMMSPFEKIAQEMDQMEQERRDQVTPLSPISSRASSRNSMSSASSYGRRNKPRIWERNTPTRGSEGGSTGTMISSSSSLRTGHDSVSVRSTSSASSSKYQQSSLRQEMFRSPDEVKEMRTLDLFPFIKARLTEVKFRTPRYGQANLTPDVLRKEMLSVVFGWDHDIDALVRDELSRHRQSSGSAILLSKWLGDLDPESAAQMIGSDTMTSSDWMLLALSSSMGQGSKQMGEVYVRKLLEKDEVHPAVAILLGLGEQNDAVEVYVSRRYFMEAVLLTCLLFPTDWQRQSYLVRKWGEIAVSEHQPELAVRCFSCTTIESSEPWFSPRAQKEFSTERNDSQDSATSPATSPLSAGNPSRLTTKNASLKLITSFGGNVAAKPQHSTAIGVTPIIDSALSPGGAFPSKRSGSRGLKEPSSARTATPSGYHRRRAPSAGLSIPEDDIDGATPLTDKTRVPSRPGSRSSNAAPGTAIKPRRNVMETLPSPALGVFNGREEVTRSRDDSRDRNHHNLKLRMTNTVETEDTSSSHHGSDGARRPHRRSESSNLREPGSVASTRLDDLSPLMTDGSSRSYKGRNIDRYISSLEEANHQAQQLRAQSRSRSRARQRDTSETREQSDVKYIKPSKRSPSSPVPMSLEDDTRQATESPIDPKASRARERSRPGGSRSRTSSKPAKAPESPDAPTPLRSERSRNASRGASRSRQRQTSPEVEIRSDRGRSHGRRAGSRARSSSSPSPMDTLLPREDTKSRQRSTSRAAVEAYLSGRRTASPERSARARSSSRRTQKEPTSALAEKASDEFYLDDFKHPRTRARALSRKELAAKELEDRRLSLVRKPSGPSIPLPGDSRPSISPRSFTDESGSTTLASFHHVRDFDRERSQTVDPEHYRHSSKSLSAQASNGNSRAMRQPRYGSSELESRAGVPAVPALPDNLQTLAPISYQVQGRSNDTLAPLLPSTTYNVKPPLPRSNSAPPEQSLYYGGVPPQRPRQGSIKSSHSRRGSERDIPIPPPATEIINSIDATINDSTNNNIIIVEEDNHPPVLPELQHLAGPPPPPPPPPPPVAAAGTSSGMINIAMDNSRGTTPAENTSSNAQSNPMPSTSPNLQRRGRGSGGSGSESLTSKWKNVRDRMRSNSRNRTKSPPQQYEMHTPSPYETQLPPANFGRSTRSPDYAGPYDGMADSGLPPMPGSSTSNASSPTGAYRNHRDIRAALEQERKLAPGVYHPSPVEGGMI
ncbi:MAG: hypothetical protein M1828_004639 [Chrysothrix sp. TS-e1954]|nr:MAG: hypothetical protein M1828_004639 [Chrysothrix sp. TS-e1954]